MKKILALLFGLVLIILESTLFTRLRVAGVIPNLTLIMVISIGLVEGSRWGRNIGLFMGLTQDVLFTSYIGVYALIYFLIGHISGYGHRVLRRGNLLTPVLLILAGDILYGAVSYLFSAFLVGQTNFGYYWNRIILPEASYTGFFILPVYCLIAGVSHLLDGRHLKDMITRNFTHRERIES